MFIYQAVIMAVVAVAIYILSYFLRSKKRKLLVTSIIGLIVIGGIGLYAVQYYFGNHFYNQKVNTEALANINFTDNQKKNLSNLFSDYSDINLNSKTIDAIGKTYKVNGNGASSTIEANIYLFSNEKDADNYIEASQKFYENKNYIPLDSLSTKKKGPGNLYLVSLIKSQYKDYTDLIYLPSKITYTSDVVIKNSNIIILITETSNKPVTNKDTVINSIESKLK